MAQVQLNIRISEEQAEILDAIRKGADGLKLSRGAAANQLFAKMLEAEAKKRRAK